MLKKLCIAAAGLLAVLMLGCALAPCAHAQEVSSSESASVAGAIAELRSAGDASAEVVVASGFDDPEDLDPYFEGLTGEERLYAAAHTEVDMDGVAHYSVVAFATKQWSTDEELASEPALASDASFNEILMDAWDNLYGVVYVENCNIKADDFSYAYMSAFYKDVDMFNVLRAWNYSWDDDTKIVTQVKPTYYTTDAATYRSMQAAYEAKVNEAIASVPCGATDAEKVYILHNYLCNATTYATSEYAADRGKSGTAIQYPLIFTGYGALVDAKGIDAGARCVCEGYSKTLCDLLGRVGVEAINLAVFQIGHAWTLVKVDGQWYHVDATWDDISGYNTGCDYDYFMMTDAEAKDTSHYGWTNGNTGKNGKPSYGWSGQEATSTTYSGFDWSDFTVTTTGEHTWGEGAVTTLATCTASGLKTLTCTECGATKTEVIAARGGSHSWGAWQTVRQMICGKNAGIRKRACTICGATEQEEVTSPEAHTWGVWKTTKEATCAEAGTKERTCSVCGTKETQTIAKLTSVTMYRLYNPYSGEHLYTSDTEERDFLTVLGWKYEGLAWTAPSKSNTPVYRLYNKYSGDHHFTTNKSEYDACVAQGWTGEGIGFYSDDAKGATVYRLYNKYLTAGTHHYTPSKTEYDYLGKIGWNKENIAWYGLSSGSTTNPTSPTSPTTPEDSRHSQYSYEVYLVSDKELLSTPVATEFDNGSGNEGMQQYSYPLFIKTNNPNSDIQLDVLDSEGNSVVEYRYEANYGFTQYNDDRFSYGYHDTYCDIVYADNNAKASLQKNKVDGGFVYDLRIKKAGTYTLKITEESYNVGRLVYRIQGPSFTITVKDWTEAENAWIDAQIAKYTTSSMNSNEKLAAIAKGLNKDFSYLTYSYIGGMERRVAYTTDVGAYFQNYHWDSLVSPTVLCKIAQRLGGFEKIENLYYGDSWSAHDLCRVTYEGTTYTYSACPSLSTGEVAIDDIFNRPKVDLTNTSALRKLTKIAS